MKVSRQLAVTEGEERVSVMKDKEGMLSLREGEARVSVMEDR